MLVDEGVMMPRRATTGSAGYDIFAPKRIVLNSTEWQSVDLGFRFEPGDMGKNVFAHLVVRSSSGNKKGVHLRTGCSVIDSDYYLNVRATMKTDGDEVVFEKGDRILQFILIKHELIPNEVVPVDERVAGEGSTGR